MSSGLNLKYKTSKLRMKSASLALFGGWFGVFGGSFCLNELELMLI